MGYGENKKKFQNQHQEKKNKPEYVKTPVTEAFEIYSKELESKQDKYERIVKLSRDATIASKRAIFALHALMRSNSYENDLAKVTDSLNTIKNTQLKGIALELVDEDPYQFSRAYTSGLQEYIEAVTFYHFITKGKLFNLDEVKKELMFQDVGAQGDTSEKNIELLVPLFDYILGVQDLTGELMRHCINSFGVHNKGAGFSDCNFVRHLYSGMLFLNMHRSVAGRGMQGRDFSYKLNVTLQSLSKMEMACYSSHIRGSETPDFRCDPFEPSNEFDS